MVAAAHPEKCPKAAKLFKQTLSRALRTHVFPPFAAERMTNDDYLKVFATRFTGDSFDKLNIRQVR